MAASYPASLKSFTQRADGQVVYADHMNQAYDEIEAIQAELGTDPAGAEATVKARIAAIESGYSQTGHAHDHGALTGLGDDDHTQYTKKATLTTKGDIYAATAASTIVRLGVGTDGQVLEADSGQASGLNWTTPAAGVTDHGALTGLADDDHTQYLLVNGTRAMTGELNTNNNDIDMGGGEAPGVLKQFEVRDFAETIEAHPTPGTTETLNLNNGNVQTLDLDADCTLTFSKSTGGSGMAISFTLIVTQDSTPRTITWPGNINWSGAEVPTLSTGSGHIDIFTFISTDEGTSWYGMTVGQVFG